MTLTVDDDARTRLTSVRDGITREFGAIRQDEIDRRFAQIVTQLLDEATFGDFVPVLAWRYTREALERASSGSSARDSFRAPPRPPVAGAAI